MSRRDKKPLAKRGPGGERSKAPRKGAAPKGAASKAAASKG